MLIILSQKIDTSSKYSDEMFTTYHYPARYKNQIHEGDTFVYYQGNRFVKEQRYYFGSGTVGKISTSDGENYYAELINGQKFNNNVPIYLPDGKYVEQLGYDTIRKSPLPPWQSSIRPLSQQAFDYIMAASGIILNMEKSVSFSELKELLKNHVRALFLNNDINAIIEIKNISSKLIDLLHLTEKTQSHNSPLNNRQEQFLTIYPSEKSFFDENKFFRENAETEKAGVKSVSLRKKIPHQESYKKKLIQKCKDDILNETFYAQKPMGARSIDDITDFFVVASRDSLTKTRITLLYAFAFKKQNGIFPFEDKNEMLRLRTNWKKKGGSLKFESSMLYRILKTLDKNKTDKFETVDEYVRYMRMNDTELGSCKACPDES